MDDLISRQKVCDWLKWYGNDAVKEGYKPSMIYAWKYIRDQIPSTDDVRPVVRGEWIDTGSGQICSVCNEFQGGYDNFRNYCPNCGADMRGNKNG